MSSTGEVWRLGHRPALDGVRGVAVLLVVASHVELPLTWTAGQVGVTIFFALSGFLIATLLFEEHGRVGRVSLVRFYRRRGLRLLPALFAVVAACVGVTIVTGVDYVSGWQAFGAVFYCSNILSGLDVPVRGGMLQHTWSLVIEEQFYLVWPSVFLVFRRRHDLLLGLLVAAAALSSALRLSLFLSGADDARWLFGTDTRIDALLFGCALAVALRGRAISPSPVLARLGIALVLLLAFTGFTLTIGLTLAALGTLAVIVGILGDQSPRWLSARPLVVVGQRSYGLYLWHHPVLIFAERSLGLSGAAELCAFVLPVSALLTVLSWRYIEQPFLRFRERSPVAELPVPALP